MARRKFTIQTEDFNDPTTDSIGGLRDTWLDEAAPTWNYGGSNTINVQNNPTTGDESHVLFEIQMPSEDDILGFDELIKVEIVLIIPSGSGTAWIIFGIIVPINDIWDEGALSGGVGECSWNDAQLAVPWTNAGAIKTRVGSVNSEETVVDSVLVPSVVASPITLDLTPELSMGDKKTFVIAPIKAEVIAGVTSKNINSFKHTTPASRSFLRITYRSYPPDAFVGDESLTIEPNPNNQEQPLLKWGGVKDADFVDFKLFRETVPITSVAALTPIATITSPADQEYVDTYAHVDGTTYYYLVIAEDYDNTLDDATKSNLIAWKKPNILTRTLLPTGAITAGDSVTATVTSSLNIKRLYIDWKDGCASWYDFETVIPAGSNIIASHIYSMYSASYIYPKVQVEDEDGFWSDLMATIYPNEILVDDAFPTAKLRVSVKKGQLGDYVTLDASLSQPVASNITISKYEFKRDAADAYQDNGTNPIYTYKTGTGGGEYPTTIGIKTATVRITTTAAAFNQDTDTATYDLETGTATELALSHDTKIHEWNHDLSLDKLVEVPIGSDRVAHEFLISRPPERLTLVGTSNHPNVGTDIALIRGAWLANTFVKFVIKSEMEGKTVTYEGKIDGDISLGQSYDYKQSWTFPFRVIKRTLNTGSITAFANAGGGKVTATTINHGLSVGDSVTISETTNYNGTFTITAVTNYTFTFTDTWVSDDATGEWLWIEA